MRGRELARWLPAEDIEERNATAARPFVGASAQSTSATGNSLVHRLAREASQRERVLLLQLGKLLSFFTEKICQRILQQDRLGETKFTQCGAQASTHSELCAGVLATEPQRLGAQVALASHAHRAGGDHQSERPHSRVGERRLSEHGDDFRPSDVVNLLLVST